jgi:molybdenum cofactor cytidylyltransferase
MVESACLRPQIAAVILAAGGSQRMGQPKQLLPIDGQPMIRRVAEAVCAARLAHVVVVTGAAAEQVRAAIRDLPIGVVFNPHWAEGVSTSLRAGIGALRPEIQAALVVLADQPGLTPGLIRRVVDCYVTTFAPIIVPVYEGQRGNPVLFDRRLFTDLLRLEGDCGGRALFPRYEKGLHYLDVDDPAVIRDVDDWAGYLATRETTTEPC